MNEREILDKLSCDISEIELPPISENVLQALREKNENCGKTNENHIKPVKTHKKLSRKYAFAAIIAFFLISLPIIVVLSNNNTNPVITEESQISNNSKSDVSKSDTPNETNNPSVLEKIKLKEVYGTVALTKRPEEECELYLMNYDPDNSIYEDDNYLYNFDSDGNLVEIINTHNSPMLKEELNKSTIIKKAEDILIFYYPSIILDEYTIDVQKKRNALPEWIVNCSKTDDNITQNSIHMTFDKTGMLCMLILNDAATNVGNISKMQAIEIALDEIKSGKYDIQNFSRRDVDIEIKLKSEYGLYIVSIDNIPVGEEDFTIYAVIKIDYNNGNILNTEIIK